MRILANNNSIKSKTSRQGWGFTKYKVCWWMGWSLSGNRGIVAVMVVARSLNFQQVRQLRTHETSWPHPQSTVGGRLKNNARLSDATGDSSNGTLVFAYACLFLNQR